MCIIVVKDKKTELPKEEYLKNCFENNPDGAGFMYTKHNKVIVDKGYMTYSKFLKRYKKLCKKFNNFENKALIMHFRIGTAGTNSKENTHPYTMTDSISQLHKTYIKTDLGMVHNGIISDYNPSEAEKKMDINDTQNFIIKYLYPLYSHYRDFYKNEYIMQGLEDITKSKLAFLDKNDIISLVGEFEKDENGVLYSNSTYNKSWYNLYYYDYPLTKSYSDEKEESYVYDLQLEPNWYVSIEGKQMEKVGDRRLIVDYYDGCLYELTDLNKYEFITDIVEVFDENGEEIIL